MKRCLFALVSATLLLPLGATEQRLRVTPRNLAGWTVTGTDKGTLMSGVILSLPPGAQLSRDFSGGAVILRLVSRPVFSEVAQEWPVVSVGSAALTLIRKDGQGRLVLVIDGKTATALPWSVHLDPAHEISVEVVLAYDALSGIGLVGLQDEVQLFDAPLSTNPIELLLSNGAKAPWSLDTMQVILLAADGEESDRSEGLGGSPAKDRISGKLQSAADRLLRKEEGIGGLSVSTGSLTERAANNATSTLEIFTPSSTRRVRVVEAVQGSLAKSLAQ